MNRTLSKVNTIIALVVLTGLVCHCKSHDLGKQVFEVIETEGYSIEKMIKKINGGSKSPSEIGNLLAQTQNKSSVLELGSYNVTVGALLALNNYDSVNMTDCTIVQIERRDTICTQLSDSSNLQKYCRYCVKKLIEFCHNYPYKRMSEATFSQFDWDYHNFVLLFAQNVSTYIVRDGNEELPVKDNVASFLATKDSNYTLELKFHCNNFEMDVKSKLYHFESTPDQSFELLRNINEDIYTIWERCKAIDDGSSGSFFMDMQTGLYLLLGFGFSLLFCYVAVASGATLATIKEWTN